jgi:hypothetical protein
MCPNKNGMDITGYKEESFKKPTIALRLVK